MHQAGVASLGAIALCMEPAGAVSEHLYGTSGSCGCTLLVAGGALFTAQCAARELDFRAAGGTGESALCDNIAALAGNGIQANERVWVGAVGVVVADLLAGDRSGHCTGLCSLLARP